MHTILHANTVASFFNPNLALHVKESAEANEVMIEKLLELLSTPIERKNISSLKATILCEAQEYQEAMNLFLTLLDSSDPVTFKTYLYNIGICNLRMQKLVTAAEYFTRVIKCEKDTPDPVNVYMKAANDALLQQCENYLTEIKQVILNK